MTQQMTRAQRAEQIAYYEALAVAAKEAAEAHRTVLKAAAGDEYRTQRSVPTWRISGIGTVSGRTTNDTVVIDNPADFLAWVRVHKPDEVETVDRVRATYQTAVLKGCTVNDDGLIVTATGDEITGVKFVAGGVFQGIACKFDDAAKETYASLAVEALSRVALSPEPAEPSPADAGVPVLDPVASFLATTAPSAAEDPWNTPAPDPWATPTF